MTNLIPHSNSEMPVFVFDTFELDATDRQLWRNGQRVDLNARYFDALALLVRESPQLVSKDRLFAEVWQDVVVGDSALSQCIKELRKTLGDEASDPRFIQTVPGHGYRFVAPVVRSTGAHAAPASYWTGVWQEGLFGALGGALAGGVGGLLYGFALSDPATGIGTLSTLMVLVALNVLVGLTGGVGVSGGLAAGRLAARFARTSGTGLRILGATLGGLFIGGLSKMLGVDAFNLLLGRAPAGITGGPEGAALGAAIAIGMLLGARFLPDRGFLRRWKSTIGAGLCAGLAGLLIPAAGGHLMAGSLHLLATSFDESRLEPFARLLGDLSTGLPAETLLAGMEGLLFGLGVGGALDLVRRYRPD
jgi:DNA-binding winged helix-turn-helix (wHTH) protein